VDLAAWGRDGLRQVPPQWMLKYLPNMAACHASILADAQGPNNSVTAGDVAGLLALGEAYRILGRDLADAFLVGGCESKINPVSLARHNTFQPLTRKNDAPQTAVRPFDLDRDGTAVGEAGVTFGLEELEFAKKRGAPILAELVAFASGFDRGREGPVMAGVIRNVLKQAGIRPADVDHVNAAAAGDPRLDAWEARAIAEVFGTDVPVYAPKAHFGNTGAAAGLLELAASVLALKHGELPGTPNYTTPDPGCPVRVHTGEPRPVTKPYVVKVSYTDAGQCAAAVVRKWDG
jgi:3-oxoacyl-[acyl-carrier-protein] synthase II